MQIAEFLDVLRRRWLYVVTPVVICVAVAAYVSASAPRIYQASSSLYFSMPYGDSASDLFQGSNYTQQQLASYATLATSPIVLERVIDDLGTAQTVASLRGSVSAAASPDTVIIQIRASSASPETAADVANAVAGELASVVKELSPTTADGSPVVDVTVIAEAVTPSEPYLPRTRLNLVAGFLAGFFLGVLAAIGRDRLDTRVRDATDLPAGVPVLGSIFFDRSARRNPLLSDGPNFGLRAEEFRRLRTNLRFIDVDDPARVFAVTSAVASEGKSSTAVNLATSFAEAGARVLLVDADLRRPRVAEYLGLEGGVGLADVLSGRVDLADALQPGSAELLSVLASGTIPPNPAELLASQKMMNEVRRFKETFDYVIIDTPPLLPVTDGAVVAAYTDGAVLVTAHERLKRGQLQHALDALHAVGARILGVVFNMVPRPTGDGPYGYRQYGYLPREEAGAASGKVSRRRGGRREHRRETTGV